MLFWPSAESEQLIGVLRALAVLGLMLTLGGLLARRMTQPGLPG